MSIPLVQDNNKDSINTSIIAIKRNIERINMLLGLSNSEEIDTSKFATKDELQQAVTDLQPVDEVTVGNMQSVTSNAVAKCLSYATSEVDTGAVWIDGKRIYRKVVDCGSLPISTTKQVNTNISNLMDVIKINGIAMALTAGQTKCIPLPYVGDNNNLNLNISISFMNNGNIEITTTANLSNYKAYIYIEYTKTTD